jgi:pimeloyl-ACP methyl ester carboxylesterase
MKLLIILLTFILLLGYVAPIAHAENSALKQKLGELRSLIDKEPHFSFRDGATGKMRLQQQINQAILSLHNNDLAQTNSMISCLFADVENDFAIDNPLFKDIALWRLSTTFDKDISMFAFADSASSNLLSSIAQSSLPPSQEIISVTSTHESYETGSINITNPHIAVDSNGNWHAVYVEITETPIKDLHISLTLKYLGSNMSTPVIIDSVTDILVWPFYYIYPPSIAIDSKNNVHIIYCKAMRAYDLNGQKIAVSTINYVNNVADYWSPPQGIVSTTHDLEYSGPTCTINNPDIAIDSNDNWHVVYVESPPPYFTNTVKYISSNTLSPMIINSYGLHAAYYFDTASIAIDSENNIHIAYRTSPLSSDHSQAKYAINYVNNVAGSWSPPQEIISEISNPAVTKYNVVTSIGHPDITVDSDGNWYIVYWERRIENASYLTNTIKYLSSSTPAPMVIDSGSTGINCYVDSPSIASDSKNNIHIAYSKNIWTPDQAVISIMYAQIIGQPSLEILDGVDFSEGREVWDSLAKIASGGIAMEGAVTDGVSRLLLRMTMDEPGSVTFSTGSAEEDGILRSIGGFQEGISVTVNTTEVNGKNYAFAIYQAPENFVRSGHEEDKTATERRLTIKAQVGINSPTQKEIKLVRPPLILIHGLWAKPAMWDAFKPMLNNKIPDLQIYTVDYSKTNDESLSDNINVPYSYDGGNIEKVKKSFKAKKIAMVQADILGHSMGGLLARIWAGENDYVYRRDNNFWMGDINKLITLGSPHYGSFLADLGIACIQYPHTGWQEIYKGIFIMQAEEKGYDLTAGALFDLTTDSYPLRGINKTAITTPCHAIIGNYPVASLDDIPVEYGNIYIHLRRLGFDATPIIIGNMTDLVASFDSQSGGLTSSYRSVYTHHHMNTTTESVADRVVELLNENADSASFNVGFPVEE